MTDPSGHVASLFLQLQRRAVAGPLAARGIELTMLPGACITTWTDWLKAHPDTTIALRDAASIRRMKEISYARYFLSPQLEYPAAPLPSDSAMATIGLRLKSPMMLFESGGRWRMFSVEAAAARARSSGTARAKNFGRYFPQAPQRRGWSGWTELLSSRSPACISRWRACSGNGTPGSSWSPTTNLGILENSGGRRGHLSHELGRGQSSGGASQRAPWGVLGVEQLLD
jgi:hypothetical protein